MRNDMRAAFVLALVIIPAGVRAQCPVTAQTGHLGISQLECDCVIAPVTRTTQWRFNAEPKILRIERGSPADGRLQRGDVIVSINGQAVTTASGANLLARPPHDRNITIAVRRDGRVLQHTLRATAVCPTDERLLGVMPAFLRVPATPVSPAPPQRVTSPVPPAPPVSPAPPQRVTRPTSPAPPQGVTPPVPPAPPVASPTVWIGLAFSCDDCTYRTGPGGGEWSFRTAPTVYSVEPGSPAYTAGLRRGDVLTHIDDVELASADGGRRWAALQAGDRVRLRYRRGDATRTTVLLVAPARTPSYALADQLARTAAEWQAVQQSLAQRDTAARRLLRQYEQTISTQQAAQERLMQQLRRSTQPDVARAQAETALRTFMQQQERLQSQQQSELRQLLRQSQVELSRREAAASARLEEQSRASVRASVATVQPTPLASTQRYSGTFGGIAVEVRGGNPVIVSEEGDELVIRMADGSTVRLRRQR